MQSASNVMQVMEQDTVVSLVDVAKWYQEEQVVYWKSRAISLQLENQMLHEHVRNMYLKQIDDYELYLKEKNRQNCVIHTKGIQENKHKVEKKEQNFIESNIIPVKQLAEQRQTEMKDLYQEMAPKIIGMETAVQLNYNMQVSRHKPHYWPNIPLKL